MNDPPASSEFVSLLTSYQRRLYGYIATFLPHPDDTEEVLQQTNVVLWSKFAEFRPDSSFRAWSFRIAYLEVLAFLRRHARERRIFSPELIEKIAVEQQEFDEMPALAALRTCISKLSAADRELLERRYTAGVGIQQIAEQTRRPPQSIYRSLDRIRCLLFDCVRRALLAEDRP